MPQSDAPARSDAQGEETGHPRRWWILAILVVSLLVVVIDNTILNVALKTLADPHDGLGASQSELAWMVNSYTLVFAGLLFAFGVVGDRLGRKVMIMAGLVVFGVASLLSAYADSPLQLILFRSIMGMGAAMMMPSTLSMLRAVFPAKEFPKALAVWTAAVGASGALGPLVGGALLERFWWGSVFLVNVPIVVFGLLFIGILAPESRGRQGKPDVVGMLLSVAGLVTLTYGIIEAGESGTWNNVEAWGTMAVGGLILVWFIWWEAITPHASLDVSLFKKQLFSVSAFTMTLVFFISMGLMFFMSFYLQIVRGYSPMQAGLLFLPTAISMLLFAPGSNNLVQKLGPKTVGIGGMLLLIGSVLVVTRLEADTPIVMIVVAFSLQGVGMAYLMPPAMTTLMNAMPSDQAGVGSALSNTLRQVGGALGVAVLSTVMAQDYRRSLTEEIPVIRGEARESVASTYAALDSVDGIPPPVRMFVLEAADRSFISAMHVTAYTACAIAVVGLIVVALFYPRRERQDVPQQRRAETPDYRAKMENLEWGPPLPPLGESEQEHGELQTAGQAPRRHRQGQ
ncbi:MFS transporter [Haloglycomyces albus]|uniref:MFS transporter n=1 Tax=Haloglycomyces albus TaxID=526067 RepID=UPI00046D235B|nr:MFS transporter [Haloglycomyces albus]